MIHDESWLELSEVSVSAAESLDIEPHQALHLFLENNHPLASVVVQAVEFTSNIDKDEEPDRILIHPFLFEFLSMAVDLVDAEADKSSSNNNESRRNEKERVVAIGPLPIEPLGDIDRKWESLERNWVLRPINILEMKNETQVCISCIHLDSGVKQRIQQFSPEEIQSLFEGALEGRLLKEGCVLCLSTLYGVAIVQVVNTVMKDDDDIDVQVDPTVAYRWKAGSTRQLNVKLPVLSNLSDDGDLEDIPSGIQLYSDIPGYDSLVEEIISLFRYHGSTAAPSGILLTGCAGVGKSRLASCLIYNYNMQKEGCRVCYLSTQDLIFRAITENDLLEDVIVPQLRHCTLWIIDDLHLLEHGDSDEEQRDIEYTIVQNSIIQAMEQYCGRCRVLGIGQEASKLPEELTKIGRLEKNILMLPPTQSQRFKIWKALLHDDETSSVVETWSSALANATAGCVVSDLVHIYKAARTRSWAREKQPRNESQIRWEELREAARTCVPSQLSELDVSKPAMFNSGQSWAEIYKTSWNPFGGYEVMKSHVFRQVVVPWRHFLRNMDVSDSQKAWLEPPSGVLFHGPPGCGKTLAAKCLAASLELPMIQVRAADVLDKWLGGSEALLRSLFARARAASPCVLFLDEIDSIANNRAEDATNDFTSRILSTLLNEMDGVSSAIKKSRVLVLACTNRLEDLDSALLRPGRLQEHFYLETPTAEDLAQILKLRLSKVPLDSNLSIVSLSKRLRESNATGADVEGLCREVCFIALRRFENPDDLVVSKEDFCIAIDEIWKWD